MPVGSAAVIRPRTSSVHLAYLTSDISEFKGPLERGSRGMRWRGTVTWPTKAMMTKSS